MYKFQINNDDESHVMYDKLNNYILSLKKDKMKDILEMFNKIFHCEYDRLSKFKNINENYLQNIKDVDNVLQILKFYSDNLKIDLTKFKSYLEDPTDPNDSSESLFEYNFNKINKELFSILSKILKTIQYKLKKWQNKKSYDVMFE
jgi:hypothetical protein